MVVGQDIELDRNWKFGVSGEDTMKTVGFFGFWFWYGRIQVVLMLNRGK